MWYNIGLFDEAGLNYPPAKYGDKYKMPDGSEVEWNWDTVQKVAQMLTLDKNGKNATDAAFDKNSIVQYGFSWQWENKPSYWGTYWQFGPDDTFLVPGGSAGNYQARIPDAWKASWKWAYDGMYGAQPYIPNGAVEGSADFNSGNSFASGKIAMAEMPSWYLCCVGDLEKAGGKFDFAAMPTYNGKVGGRVDADTFRIWKGTKHPQEAWEVLKYLIDTGIQKLVVGTKEKAPAYGAIPSNSSLRDLWLESSKTAHPSVTNWDVLLEGLNYPDAPSAEGYMPNMNEAWNRTVTFSNLLQNTADLDIDKESETLRKDLEVIFNK
jgi:multiple sugar transport system substrate-binding protein